MIKETCNPASRIEMKNGQTDITLDMDIVVDLAPVDKQSGTVYCAKLNKDGNCDASPTKVCWINRYDLYTTVVSKT